MRPSTFASPARAALALVSAAAALTLVTMVYRYPAPEGAPLGVHPMPAWQSLGLHATSTALLSLSLLLAYWEKHRRAPGLLSVLLLVWLIPIWALSSVPLVLATALGHGHPFTLLAFLVIYGLPVIGAWRSAARHGEAVREHLGRAAIVVLALMVAALLLEAGLRVSGYRPVDVTRLKYINPPFVPSAIPGVRSEMRPSHRWGIQFPSNERGYFDRRNAVWYRTNNVGYRGRDFSLERRPSTVRIAFIGDSFAFGHGVKDEDVVTTLLETQLTRRIGCPVEVYNFSVQDYDIIEKAAVLEHRALSYRPDLIIVWYLLNDPGRGVAAWVPRFFVDLRKYSRLAEFAGAQGDRAIEHYLALKVFSGQHRDTDGRWVEARRHLKQMAAVARERGIPSFLFVHPVLFRLTRYPFADIHREVVKTAEGYGFRAFDLMEAFRGREAEALWVHSVDHHPNELAHRIAADYVAGVLSGTSGACKLG